MKTKKEPTCSRAIRKIRFVSEEQVKRLRSKFLDDLSNVLHLHLKCKGDPQNGDPLNEDWENLLDACQNMFVKWVVKIEE